MKKTIYFIELAVAVCLFVWMACGVEGCRKRTYERVVGHPISWFDYIIISGSK